MCGGQRTNLDIVPQTQPYNCFSLAWKIPTKLGWGPVMPWDPPLLPSKCYNYSHCHHAYIFCEFYSVLFFGWMVLFVCLVLAIVVFYLFWFILAQFLVM